METIRDNELYQVSAEESNTLQIDVLDLLLTLWRNVFTILLGTAVFALAAYIYVSVMVTPVYSSTATMYVINAQNYDTSLSYSDIQSSTLLVNDYRQLIRSDSVVDQAITELGLTDLTASKITENLSVTVVNETRFLNVKYTDPDPYRAADVANKICEVSCTQFQEIMNVDKASIVDQAKVPTVPSSPHVKKYVLFGGLMGMAVVVLYILIRYIMDDTLKTSEDVEQHLGLSILGNIPEMESLAKKNKKKKSKKNKK
ncbi:MAG: hypothetical protein IJV50_03925 [Lachnospiraceae bacterium]|nr:hypothetical protein [Lachnospiraceae bacterium]